MVHGENVVRSIQYRAEGFIVSQNPYESPNVTPAHKPLRNWSSIIARWVGALLLLLAVAAMFSSGILALGLIAIGFLLLFTGSVRDLYFPSNERQMLREIKRKYAREAEDENKVPPEDFLRQLEQNVNNKH